LDKNELIKLEEGQGPVLDRNAQVNLYVNHTDEDEDEIDFGRVFHRMKCNWRSFLCMLICFAAIGVCVALIIYQATKEPQKVSSVVTLKYMVPDGSSGEVITVSDLTAPDGTNLDLTQVYSSYVLRNALKDITLSEDISIEDIQSSIVIERMLTDESLRQQEIASEKYENKDIDAYEAVQNLDIKYKNMFIVSLLNRFGKEKLELPDEEVRELLDAILSEYNEYLLVTYPALRLPDDEISAIRVNNIDILESLDQLNSSVQNLYNYCSNKNAKIQDYRSFQTGRTLRDWMEELETVKEVNIDYLYANVNANNIEDQESTLTNYESRLQDARARLNDINNRIASLEEIINKYENENVYVAVQDNLTAKNTTITTDYYNDLVLQQTANYAQASSLEATIALLERRIDRLENASPDEPVSITTEEAKEELSTVLNAAHTVYESINDHMQEIMEQPLYRNYTEHSSSVGKTENFIVASKKNLLICVGVAALLAFLAWFFKGLAPEFSANRDKKKESNLKNDIRNSARSNSRVQDPGTDTTDTANFDKDISVSKTKVNESGNRSSGASGRRTKKSGKESAK
jgi:exonuclease VII small subunit